MGTCSVFPEWEVLLLGMNRSKTPQIKTPQSIMVSWWWELKQLLGDTLPSSGALITTGFPKRSQNICSLEGPHSLTALQVDKSQPQKDDSEKILQPYEPGAFCLTFALLWESLIWPILCDDSCFYKLHNAHHAKKIGRFWWMNPLQEHDNILQARTRD